jgi:hypothetical protein
MLCIGGLENPTSTSPAIKATTAIIGANWAASVDVFYQCNPWQTRKAEYATPVTNQGFYWRFCQEIDFQAHPL